MELDLVPSEDEIGGYIPLERPSCTNTNTDHAAARPQIVYSDEESHHEVSSDDSDDAKLMKNPRKRKISPANPPPRTDAAKKKKFNIWSDILQEDAMENQFNDSKFFGGSRGNETYNYRMKYFVNGNENEKTGCSMNGDSKNVEKLDIKNRPWAKRRKFNRKLKLSSLEVTAEDTEQMIAIDIAKKLNEPKTDLIEKIVNTLGKQKAIDLYNKTKDIEQKGGYLTLDKSRRRTSGGVFLKLVKDDNKLSKKQFDAIFKYADDFNKKFNKSRRLPQEEDEEDMNIEEGEIRDEDEKDLPTRAELELSLSIEDQETNVLKNPPPSPVYPTTSLSNNACSLSEDFFPNDYSPPRRSSSPFRNSDSASKDSTSITMNSNSTNYYSPISPDYIPTYPEYSPASARRIPKSPDYLPVSPDPSPASPDHFPTSPGS